MGQKSQYRVANVSVLRERAINKAWWCDLASCHSENLMEFITPNISQL